MKTFLALFTLLSLTAAHADTGTIESHFSPDSSKHHGHDREVVNLYLQNNCHQDVFVATRSQNPNTVWETKSFKRLYPGQVVSQGSMLNNIYYLSGFTADHSTTWEGEHRFEVRGKTVRAILVELPKEYEGNWTTVLYCR